MPSSTTPTGTATGEGSKPTEFQVTVPPHSFENITPISSQETETHMPHKVTVLPSPPLRRSRSKGISTLLLQTDKLEHITTLNSENKTLQDIHKALSKARRILVLTGAGISCNAGIPDFRSSNGLYNLLKRDYPNLSISSGKELFDISLFMDEDKLEVWATFMDRLHQSCVRAKPTKTHRFIAHLKDRNKLLRCYTQNIDGLERSLGLNVATGNTVLCQSVGQSDVIQLHGDLDSFACTRCFKTFPWSRFWARSLRRGELPACPNCEETNMRRLQEGKRVIDNNFGLLRPNIVLYGENHPTGEIISKQLSMDLKRGKPDFFLIIGSSLRVHGVRSLVKQVARHVHERGGLVVLVNKSSVGDSSWHGYIDYQIFEDCDKWVDFMKQEMPDFFKTQLEVDKAKVKRTNKPHVHVMRTPPPTPIRGEVNSGNSKDHKVFKRSAIDTDAKSKKETQELSRANELAGVETGKDQKATGFDGLKRKLIESDTQRERHNKSPKLGEPESRTVQDKSSTEVVNTHKARNKIHPIDPKNFYVK